MDCDKFNLYYHEEKEVQITPSNYFAFRRAIYRSPRFFKREALYIKEAIQTYEIKFEKEAERREAVWCIKVTGNISIEENDKVQNATMHAMYVCDFIYRSGVQTNNN